jgi:hypothetical protein
MLLIVNYKQLFVIKMLLNIKQNIMKNKYDVLLILEGTYPFNGGGVSTWSHMLCNEVKNANFSLYSINANYELKPKYELGENVKDVIQVPLWSPLEPQEMVDYGKKFYKIIKF